MPTPKRTPDMATPTGHGGVSRQSTAEKFYSSEGFVTKKLESLKKDDSKTSTNYFGRIFPKLAPFSAPDDKLLALATAMKEDPSANLDNKKIPAGFTYLGQFIDHDISLDLSPLSHLQGDPEMIRNFRTPGLDLDCVYGTGPGPHRFLFAREPVPAPGRGFRDTAKLLVGKTQDSIDENRVNIPAAGKDNDLPRNPQGAALIGDHRNDENLLVAQTHVAFLKLHNKVVDRLAAAGTDPGDLFKKASQEVRWHYQWMVIHDFVARLCGKDVVDSVLKDGRKFYKFKQGAFMPFEFSAAAYRLGHSMVREVYSHNRVFPEGPGGLATGSLELLFSFTGLSGSIAGNLGGRGAVLPTNWIIDWRRFFDFGKPTGVPLNFSRLLDPFITPVLHTLPGFSGPAASLPFRNLKRGVLLGLPSGQAVAKEMRKKIDFNPLTPAEIATGPDGAVAKAQGFDKESPLWYYILKEAQLRGNGGERLGPVGGRIVAEVFIGLLEGDSSSYLNVSRNWKPTLPAKTPGTFLMTDLLQFVGEISPIDGVTTV